MRNKTLLLAGALAVAFGTSSQAFAQKVPTAGELLAIQSQTAFVKAQTDLAKAQNDLATARGTNPNATGKPQIMSIMKFDSDVSAKLRAADGSMFEVRKGDKLPNGSVVTDIRSNGVSLRVGSETISLGYASGTTPATSSNTLPVSIPFGMK